MSWKHRESFGWIRIGGFVLVALLIAVGAFRVWNANAEAAEPEAAPKAVAVEPETPAVEDLLPPYMLPDPESPEFVPDPPNLADQARER